jgi:hypothetical protein
MATEPPKDITVTLPGPTWVVIHNLAFKAPTTGEQAAFALVEFRNALLEAAKASEASPAKEVVAAGPPAA